MTALLANPIMHWHQKETGGLCKLVRKQIELYANATPASKTAMQNVFPETHGTHARACPARRAKPLPRRKGAYAHIYIAASGWLHQERYKGHIETMVCFVKQYDARHDVEQLAWKLTCFRLPLSQPAPSAKPLKGCLSS